ncbi:MAG: hypothetical protein K2J85_02040, partial [Anaeroplasmataceae bacterium]|nr:hypothetical protein [Anaeroplasmataceae bacterium]
MGLRVSVKPKEIMVNWKNLDTEFNASNRFNLPIAYVVIKDGYNPYTQCPIWVSLYNDTEYGKEEIKRYLCDASFISEELNISSAGILSVEASTTSKNYILLNTYNVFIVQKITVDTPYVYSELTYDKINYTQYIDVTVSDLYDYYLDFECTIKIASVPYGTSVEDMFAAFRANNMIYEQLCNEAGRMITGDYKIYAKLRNPENYQWRDYRNPLYRESVFTLHINLDQEEIFFNLGDIILEYQSNKENLSYSYTGTVDVSKGDVVYATHDLDFKFIIPNEKGKYDSKNPNFVLTGNAADYAMVDTEKVYKNENTLTYYSDNYRIVFSGEMEVVYPSLTVTVSDTADSSYEETRNEMINGNMYIEGTYTAVYNEEVAHNFTISTGRQDATIEYSTDYETWFSANESCTTTVDFKEANTYTLYYRVTCEHYKPIYGTITLKIVKSTSKITIDNKDDLNKIYDTLAVEPVVSTTGSTAEPVLSYRLQRTDLSEEELMNLPMVDRYQLATASEAIAAGNWLLVVNLPGDDNYEGIVAYQEFTIAKRVVDIEIIDPNRIYNKQNNYDASYSLTLVEPEDTVIKFKFNVNPNKADDVVYTYESGAITIPTGSLQVFFNDEAMTTTN